MIVLPPIFDTFPGLVWIQDITGRLLWCNDTWQRFTGSKDHPNFLDDFYPADRDRLVMAVIECTRVVGWTTLQARMKNREGVYHWVCVQLGYHEASANEPAQWIGVAMESGGNRSVDDSGARHGKALSSALETARLAVWDWDLVSDDILGSRCLFELLGVDRQALHLTRTNFMHFVHPQDRAGLLARMDKTVTELGGFKQEFRIQVPGGEQRWVCASGKITADMAPSGLHMVGILYDVTSRVIREHDKDRFIGIASHELRTPVASIKGYTQLLKRQFGAEAGLDETMLLDRLAAQADRLSDLTRILLDTTRISGHELILDRSWFDLGELVGQCVDAERTAAHHDAIFYDDGHTGMVYADAERIRQVCTNLLSNAVKFSKPASPILVRTWRDENGVAGCSVQDRGEGIPDSMLDKIFEPFVQVMGEQYGAKSGLGLGLYISASIIQQHGGMIHVESKQGEGSTFWFTLPAETRVEKE